MLLNWCFLQHGSKLGSLESSTARILKFKVFFGLSKDLLFLFYNNFIIMDEYILKAFHKLFIDPTVTEKL